MALPVADHRATHGLFAFRQQGDMVDQSTSGTVSVEGIDTVVHGSHVNNVVVARDGSGCHQRLSHQLAIDGARGGRTNLAKLSFVDVGLRENGFGGVQSSVGNVVVPREYVRRL